MIWNATVVNPQLLVHLINLWGSWLFPKMGEIFFFFPSYSMQSRKSFEGKGITGISDD